MSIVLRKSEGTQPTSGAAALDPIRLLREIASGDPFQQMDRLLGWPTERLAFVPEFEVKETKEGYAFKADVPGVKEQDLDVTLTGNRLTVSGKREAEQRRDDETYFAYERSYGSFTRTFTLPEDAKSDEIRAELKDGVLGIVVPKRPESLSQKVAISSEGASATKEKTTKH